MKKGLVIFSLLLSSTISIAQYQPLYTGKIPNYIDAENEESEATTGGILRISKVSIPGYAFFPAGDDKTPRPCVIICPGGGYGILYFSTRACTPIELKNLATSVPSC